MSAEQVGLSSGRPVRAAAKRAAASFNAASTESTTKTAKRKAVEQAVSKSGDDRKQKRGTGSASLTWFLKVYKGLDDWHLPIFTEIEKYLKAKRVLYPGSDKHATASLVFPSVVYVDFNKKVGKVFEDLKVLEWIDANKKYSGTADIKFRCANFESSFEKVASFDLMISASAGIVSTSCSKYIKKGGHFLVSDAHFDARKVFLDEHFEWVGVVENDILDTSEQGKDGHFMTTKGEAITAAQVEESLTLPRNKRSFKLQKEGMFYLFKKIK